MSVLNLSAVARAPLRRDPFDSLVVEDAIAPEALAQLNRDYPLIDKPTNYNPCDLQYGESFGRLPEELSSAEFEPQVANKFAVDLGGSIRTITLRKYSEPSDGHIHTDHWSKIITLLAYFNPTWEEESGRLRILRSGKSIEEYGAEVTPLCGTIVAFRHSNRS